MRKLIVTYPERCSGCRICEMACSLTKEKECNPVKSRIKVLRAEREGLDIPIVCQHCSNPLCMMVCPVDAIKRDSDTGAVVIQSSICVGCRSCTLVCPHVAISLNPATGCMMNCDLCGGDPECVKWCEPEAIRFERADVADLGRKWAAIERISHHPK